MRGDDETDGLVVDGADPGALDGPQIDLASHSPDGEDADLMRRDPHELFVFRAEGPHSVGGGEVCLARSWYPGMDRDPGPSGPRLAVVELDTRGRLAEIVEDPADRPGSAPGRVESEDGHTPSSELTRQRIDVGPKLATDVIPLSQPPASRSGVRRSGVGTSQPEQWIFRGRESTSFEADGPCGELNHPVASAR